MKIDQEHETTRVTVKLPEFIGYGADCWANEHQHFVDFLQEKVQENIKREIDYMQIVDYCIVAHTATSITFEVEWYEE